MSLYFGGWYLFYYHFELHYVMVPNNFPNSCECGSLKGWTRDVHLFKFQYATSSVRKLVGGQMPTV
jgi:hypothetical protein